MIALKSFPPFTLAGLRFLTAGLLLLGFCGLNREEIPSSRDIIQNSFTGILLLFFGTGSVIWVEQHLTSSLTAMIWATLPIWFVLLNKRKWPANNLNYKSIIGIIIGFIGVLFLIGDEEVLNINGSNNGLISIIIAFSGTIIYAVGSLYMKYKPTRSTSTTTASVQLIAAGLLSFTVSFVIGEPRQVILSKISFDSILSLIYLIIMGSMIAYLSYVWLISVISPEIVGTYTYVNPIVAVILGWSVLHETISLQQIIALLLILSGVYLINIYKSKTISHDCKNVARYCT
ncbi:MAG: EamA family transporter [Candidatus Hodarchaeales archaeon]|jgi:drug/metabolite transporter (DMT)-like permease